jgi:hypothetical protein
MQYKGKPLCLEKGFFNPPDKHNGFILVFGIKCAGIWQQIESASRENNLSK